MEMKTFQFLKEIETDKKKEEFPDDFPLTSEFLIMIELIS